MSSVSNEIIGARKKLFEKGGGKILGGSVTSGGGRADMLRMDGDWHDLERYVVFKDEGNGYCAGTGGLHKAYHGANLLPKQPREKDAQSRKDLANNNGKGWNSCCSCGHPLGYGRRTHAGGGRTSATRRIGLVSGSLNKTFFF